MTKLRDATLSFDYNERKFYEVFEAASDDGLNVADRAVFRFSDSRTGSIQNYLEVQTTCRR